MNPDALFVRYQELQRYVGWTEDDAQRIRELAPILGTSFGTLVDDFYAEIERHPEACKVITGGEEQIIRLKGTLSQWLHNLFSGTYDRAYVAMRWQVGWRHVEIGLDQVFTNVALARLRRGMLHALENAPHVSLLARDSLNMLLDLDLAIIEDAYQAEYTARKQQSEKERSEAAFRTLIEAAPCMILIIAADHTIRYFSPYAEETTGYAGADVLGKNYLQTFIPPPNQEATSEEISQVFAGIPSRGYANPVLCRDGTPRWMVWNMQRLDNYHGNLAVLAVGQDITSLKQAQEHVLQSERLAAIGQMVTGLAHESGNALARSQACLEMLTWEVSERPEALSLIERIQKAHDHLQQLYEEVRGYAAPIKLAKESWDLSYLWRGAWENLALKRRDQEASLHESTFGLDLHCHVDHFRFDQVFRNLFENSLAACGQRAAIEIEVVETSLEGRPALRVSVRDNGPGLSPEQKRRIFEPFFTTKTKGTGLGMAIVKRIIEAHGGRIDVGQSAAPGAEIVITLPRA